MAQSIRICYIENGKAVPCKYPDKECNQKCPEWEKRNKFLDSLPTEPSEPSKPSKPTETEEEEKTIEERVKILETTVDNIIGLAYCDGAYQAGKCPHPNTRPCIYKGKTCKHLIFTVPWFTRKTQPPEKTYKEAIKKLIMTQATEGEIIDRMNQLYGVEARQTLDLIEEIREEEQ